MTLQADTFREAMRAWTTGVGVLMSAYQGQTYGVTVNSFNSLSLDPPLVTVVLLNDSLVHHLVTGSHAFSITILSAEQEQAAENFSSKLHGAERMASTAMRTLSNGLPILLGGLGWLDCRVVNTHPAGKNTLFIAEVTKAEIRSKENPLVYHDRAYHQLVRK